MNPIWLFLLIPASTLLGFAFGWFVLGRLITEATND